MCMTCGCGDYPDCHGDIRNITTLNVEGAATAAGLALETVCQNLRLALDAIVAGNMVKAGGLAEVGYDPFVKASDESRYSLGLAYPALRVDPKTAADGRRDFVRPDVLEQAAWSWMRKSASAGMYHFNGAGGGEPIDGCCEVVESYIYRGPDWMVKAADGSEQQIRAGDWLMGAVWAPEAWPMVKSLAVRGWSPEGRARRVPASPHALSELRN